MSLSKFVDTNEMKELFKELTNKVALPDDVKNATIKVESQLSQGFASGLGTAFDYMLRFKLARYINQKGQDVSDDGWIASLVVDKYLPTHYPEVAEKWKKIITRAWSLYMDYAEGKNDANTSDEKVAICVQYLAALDNLYRIGSFRPDFQHLAKVTKELLSLSNSVDLSLFDNDGVFHMNPHYARYDLVGHADADIVCGNMLVELKSVSKIQSPTAILRNLLGHVALQRLGGLKMADDSIFKEDFKTLAIFYCRFNVMAKWNVSDIISSENLEKYISGFEHNAKNYKQ
jgi:hypothetical protein